MTPEDFLERQYGEQPQSPYDQYAPTPGVSFDNPFRASSSMQQFEWAKNNPHIAQPLGKLLEYLNYLPIGRTVQGRPPQLPPRPVSSPGEWPTQAAIRVNGEVFTGSSHYDAMQAAEAKLGPGVWTEASKKQIASGGIDDGFITNKGRRYVSREEAGRMLDEHNNSNRFTQWWLTGRPKKGKDSLLTEGLEQYDPKTGRQKP